MRTNTNLEEVCVAIEDMFNRQDKQEISDNKELIHSLKKDVLIKSLQESVKSQAEQLTNLIDRFWGSLPEGVYYSVNEMEMPRIISTQPNKETGMYHETILDGATSLQILHNYLDILEPPECGYVPNVSYDFLDSQSVLNNAKKEHDKENTVFKPINTDLSRPIIVREVVTKDKDSGLKSVEYYKTMLTNFVENTADGISKVQPRLYQRLGGITQEEANLMYCKAEELIVQKLAKDYPQAFATLTEEQQKSKILPRYKCLPGNIPLPVQEAMYTKDIAHAFIAIQTHMQEKGVKEPHVSFGYQYGLEESSKLYEIALNAQNVAEETTALVLGKRIQQTVEKEKAQAAARKREQEAAGKAPAKPTETFLGAFAAVANAAVKRVKIARNRSKAVTKAKEKDQGLEL